MEACTDSILPRGQSGEQMRRPVRHLFLFIGADPNADWLAGSGVALDSKGFLLTGKEAGRASRPLETRVRPCLRSATSDPVP